MSDFRHIKSLKDLDNEILIVEARKKLLREKMSQQAFSAKQLLKPASFVWQLVRTFRSRGFGGSWSSKLIKVATEIVTSTEALKYASKLIARVFR